MSGELLRVTHVGGDQFDVDVRAHRIVVDQPATAGGSDAGPTPTELFIASLASCVAFYARRFLHRHELPTEGLAVDATYSLGRQPARVAEISLAVHVPAGVPEDQRAALLAVASHCTVHNSLRTPPHVSIELDATVPTAG